MKLLALDTSTEKASIAIMDGNEYFSDEHDSQKTHAQILLPAIERLMAQAEMSFSQLDGIVFGCGPGSFTGLRIACSIAKGIAYALDLGLIPVSSLGAIAYQVREQKEYQDLAVLSVIDARMQELYWGYFLADQYGAKEAVSAAPNIVLPSESPFILAGVGIDLYKPYFAESVAAKIVNTLEVYPNAAAMIRLSQHATIKAIAVDKAQPVYIRNRVTQGEARG